MPSSPQLVNITRTVSSAPACAPFGPLKALVGVHAELFLRHDVRAGANTARPIDAIMDGAAPPPHTAAALVGEPLV